MPIPTYCSPDEVAETLDLPSETDNYGYYTFSDLSHPSINQVNRMICANEDIIDRRMRRSWRVNHVRDQLLTIQEYWSDQNGRRSDYYQNGGHYVQLRKDILPWDPASGDKLEVRTYGNQWVDITDRLSEGEGQYGNDFIDYQYGKLYLHTRLLQPKANALRISYRYGSSEVPPSAINRLCCLMTAIQVINMQVFNVKVGSSGDLGSVKDALIKNWNEEINSIWSSYQRAGSVHSMLR